MALSGLMHWIGGSFVGKGFSMNLRRSDCFSQKILKKRIVTTRQVTVWILDLNLCNLEAILNQETLFQRFIVPIIC